MRKRLFATLLLLATAMLLLAACGNQKKDDKYVVFYLNADMTKIVPQEVELQATDTTGRIQELLRILQEQPEDAGLRQTIPKNVKVLGVTEIAYQITVDFDRDYYKLNPTEEILTRAAVAKTLLQLEKYPYVQFTVESKPLETARGTTVGAMSLDSFLENPGEQINSSQKTTLTLYFASKDGAKLVPVKREVHYSSNISLEKLVMEQLMEGPKKKGLLATIPTGTKLITNLGKSLTTFTEAASIMGLSVVGALIASSVKMTTALNFKVGEVSLALQTDILDRIMPSLLPVLLTALVYKLLGNKKWTATKLILLIIVIALVCSFFGILTV